MEIAGAKFLFKIKVLPMGGMATPGSVRNLVCGAGLATRFDESVVEHDGELR